MTNSNIANQIKIELGEHQYILDLLYIKFDIKNRPRMHAILSVYFGCNFQLHFTVFQIMYYEKWRDN